MVCVMHGQVLNSAGRQNSAVQPMPLSVKTIEIRKTSSEVYKYLLFSKYMYRTQNSTCSWVEFCRVSVLHVYKLQTGYKIDKCAYNTVLLKSNASEIRRISSNFNENRRNFVSIEFSSKVRKFFCVILYEISLSPLKFR